MIEAKTKFNANSVTIAELEAKLSELTKLRSRLLEETVIDPLKASGKEIINLAQSKAQEREQAQYLAGVIKEIEVALANKKAEQNKVAVSQDAEKNWQEYLKQVESAQKAITSVEEELKTLQEQGKAIASRHYKVYGKSVIDYRLPKQFTLPKIEVIDKSAIVHNYPTKIIK